jgi:hypothetical protein
MSTWEYCAVVEIRSGGKELSPMPPAIWYFTTTGVQVVDIQGKQEVAQTIAHLGAEGWEMVGCGNVAGGGQALYFKRAGPNGGKTP